MKETIPDCWIELGEDELIRELLDEDPLFLLPDETLLSNPSPETNVTMNQLVSSSYSGQMMQSAEDALPSVTTQKEEFHAASSSQPRLPIWERNLSKMEDNKYTLKLKCCGNGMADDGYKWRKYGQKSIKNSPYPRSYYRCTNPRCCAKKQVERSREDEDTLVITYEGLHLHFADPYFLLDHAAPNPNPPTKRPKNATSEPNPQAHQSDSTPSEPAQDSSPWTENGPKCVGWRDPGLETMSPQGLLEDVVLPFMVRNPNPSGSIISNSNTYSSSSCSSNRSSSSPSSLSWSPTLY